MLAAARACGKAANIPSVLPALKSSAGLAPLPAPVGENDDKLLGPVPELSYPMRLLTQRDSASTPRECAF